MMVIIDVDVFVYLMDVDIENLVVELDVIC